MTDRTSAKHLGAATEASAISHENLTDGGRPRNVEDVEAQHGGPVTSSWNVNDHEG